MSIHSEFPESAPSANPVFYRTYSRQTPDGRESWDDVVFRTVEGLTELGDLDEGERCIIRTHQRSQAFFPSGRWLWVGGTDWIKNPKNFFGAYNCTSTDITDMKSFALLMDMAMQGSGTGAVLDDHCVSQLPIIKCHRDVDVVGQPGDVPKGERQEETTIEADDNGFRVIVGDSREGWVNAYYFLLDLEGYTPRKKLRITFDVSHVRPSGESLRGFGGTANPIKLPELFGKIANILNKAIGRKLTAEECCLLIDEAALVVVAGNVRRSAGMRQFDKQHPLLKINLWQQGESGNWRIDPERDALRMANHTRIYHQEPTLEEMTDAVRSQFHSGEGAIQYAPEAIARANADLLNHPIKKDSFLKIYEQNPQEARQYLKSLGPAMDDRELDHRMRRFGLNPCLVAGTIVVTRDGNFPIEKLTGKEVEVWDGTQWVVVDSFRVTGENQQVYTVNVAGVKVTATASHTFILGDGSVKLLSELKAGDELMPHYKGEFILKNTKIDSIDFSHTADKVYCCTVPTTHRFALANGLMTGNCGEIIGSNFHCVAGDTALITREGITSIKDAVGSVIEIWNGKRWSPVVPLQTGTNRELYRVTFGDGSYLDVTEGHRFFVKDRFGKSYEELTTEQLAIALTERKYALHTEPFSIEYQSGVSVEKEFAYTLGLLTGDGSVCVKGNRPQIQLRLFGEKKDQILTVAGKDRGERSYYSERKDKQGFYSGSYKLYLGLDKTFDPFFVKALKTEATAFDEIAKWDKDSILQFVAGLADTDGCEVASGGIRIYLAKYERAYHLYLLLLKCGIRSSINLMAKAGEVTNMGTRRFDMMYLQITDCSSIPCQRLDTSKGHKAKHKGKNQIVRSIKKLAGTHDTYCFNEVEFHKGVFGGTLTGQCNLSEVHLNQLVGSTKQVQDQVFYAAGLSVAVLLNHQFVEERYRYSRALDPIVGVSFTGLFDFFVHEFGLNWLQWWAEGRPGEGFRAREKAYLTSWKQAAHDGVRDYCEQRGLKVPNRYTTVQPAGCLGRTALRVFDQGLLYADEIVEPGSGETLGLDLSVRGGIAADTAIANQPLNLVKVTLNNGRVLRMTPNHRLSIDGQWVRADEMTVGMKVDCSLGEYSKAENEALPGFDSIEFNEDVAYLLGCIVGGGKVLDDQIVFSFSGKRASDVAEELEGTLTANFGKHVDKVREKWQKDSALAFWLRSKELVRLADNWLIGDRLPVFIRKSSRDSILSFFCGLIDAQEKVCHPARVHAGSRENFARNLQQVAEAVGLCFSVHRDYGEWDLDLCPHISTQYAIEYLVKNSWLMEKEWLDLLTSFNDSNSARITKIEPEQTPDYSYDFAIAGTDDDDSWYWQGGIKSHNTKSLLTGASPGWHPPKAQRFIRRITFRKDDPVALACIDYGYNVVPSQSDKDENGNLLNDPFDPRCTEWLVEIPTEVPWANLPGADEVDISQFSALAQFDFYMQVQRHYTTHNSSATLEMRETEIEALAGRIHQSISSNEGYISAALLARFDSLETFPRLPFEPIDKETYQRLHSEVLQRRKSDDFLGLLNGYDHGPIAEAGPAGCDSDKCLIGGGER